MADRTPIPATVEAFEHARGVAPDGVWAYAVAWALLLRDVQTDLVDDGLREALDLVRQTHESPEDLFGPAPEHADALWARWQADGVLRLSGPEPLSWPGAVRLGLGMSSAYAVLFALLQLATGDLDAASVVRVVLVSLALGMGTVLLLALWGRRHQRPAPGSDAPADARWSLELTEVLRTRYSLSGRRVRDVVAEAHAHAHEAGRPVREEFGTATAYAARLAPDLRRRSRWTIAAVAALAGAVVVQMVDGVHWSEAGLLACLGWVGACEVRRIQRLRAH